MTAADDFWEDIFHGAAWAAYMEILLETGQFPPDAEATRRRAFRYYEESLAEKNRRPRQPRSHAA
jgi:hypothetical protein